MWVPIFECTCGEPMRQVSEAEQLCPTCGRAIRADASVFRCVSPDRLVGAAPFLAQYRAVRECDGYRRFTPAQYRALPAAPDDDRQGWVWKIRARSFRRLVALIGETASTTPAILDVGAGNGWLSYRCTTLGWHAVAVDLLVDECDGLGARAQYDRPFTCVQADFDALPFAPAQFDCVVFNASVHYSPNVIATLCEAARLLKSEGALFVVDSPTFDRDRDGIAMRRRDAERMRVDCGIAVPLQPGEGFVTIDRLGASAAAMGRAGRFFPSHDGWRRTIRRAVSAAGLPAACPAQFGVWMAA